MTPTARLLPGGERLHLQHGPSDLIIWADGARDAAYRAATRRFQTIVGEIVEELAELRQVLSPLTGRPKGDVARRMHDASVPFATQGYLTRMAAVAGGVADEILHAMTSHAAITRAYVNNGGDIAVFLAVGARFTTAIRGHDGADLGRVEITGGDGIGGIATSGRHGRSLSLGIADSVTVLAKSAAQADVAATMIANAVDLPGHPGILRRPACAVDDTSDLGLLSVVTSCAALSFDDCAQALEAGRSRAAACQAKGLISGAGLFLQGHAVTTGDYVMTPLQETAYVQA